MNVTLNLGVDRLVGAVQGAGMMASTVTIQVFDGTEGATGIPAKDVDANWDDLPGHVDLECQFAADIFQTRITQSMEQKTKEFVAERNIRHILLNRYYPQIEQDYRAVVTHGAEVLKLDILGVEHDSLRSMTRVACQLVTL